MPDAPWPILYEDNHLLVVIKPALLPTMGVGEQRPSLFGEVRQYIKQKYHKPGNVYLGIVSRLDAPVTGVVVIARTSKAAARLTRQFRSQQVQKQYWALVDGAPHPASGRLENYLRKDERHRRVHIASPAAPGAQQARLAYRTLQLLPGEGSLLEIDLETGRKHQIRVQLAHAGHPIFGDRKYGSDRPFPRGIALHARRLAFQHPVRKVPLEFVAPPPRYWPPLGVA